VTSASKPWLKHYPPGVPADINPDQYRSLVQMFDESFKTFAQRPFATCMDVTLRYRQLDELSASFGAWLQTQGLPKGARVALMLPNLLQFPVVMAGILRAGYTWSSTSTRCTRRASLSTSSRTAAPEAIVILENFAAHAATGDRRAHR
jgi:long-chain acyl-CoA synthetase